MVEIKGNIILNTQLLEAIKYLNKDIYLDGEGQILTKINENTKAIIPSMDLASFGSKDFRHDYGLKYAYVGGAMVAEITSVDMVSALVENGCLGVYGASGLQPFEVEDKIVTLKNKLKGKTYGSCLINTPHDPLWESKVVEIYLKHQVPMIEASAFLQISLPLLRYRLSGLSERPDGTIYSPNKVMAKISRVELGKRFFSPAPQRLVKKLLEAKLISEKEAELSAYIPVAQDVTAEADSGGHTDFRPAITLWPSMINLAAELSLEHKFASPLRVGVAGGIGTPWALLAAQSMGADYFMTGSINQSCVESGLAESGRALLAKASQTDVLPGPAADMFEMGAKVQVLKFGTLYAMRAQRLADAYRTSNSIEDLSSDDRDFFETNIFKDSLENIWQVTKAYFQKCDPEQIKKANSNPKHKMALIFRWYLGQSTRWAINGLEERRTDWQIFCGPSQGAFNNWAKGSPLEAPQNRKTVDLALNLLYGAAVLKRFNMAKDYGFLKGSLQIKPQTIEDLEKYMQ